jgi:hypothetical protein
VEDLAGSQKFANTFKTSTTSPMRQNQPEEILSDEKVATIRQPKRTRPWVKPVGIRRQKVDLKQLFLNRKPILFTASRATSSAFPG